MDMFFFTVYKTSSLRIFILYISFSPDSYVVICYGQKIVQGIWGIFWISASTLRRDDIGRESLGQVRSKIYAKRSE